MDTNNLRPNQGAEPNMDTNAWKDQLQPEARQRIVNKIMKILDQAGLQELEKFAQRWEENSFTTATSQSDYLRKISGTVLSMKTRPQDTMANNIPSNQVGPSPSNEPPVPEHSPDNL